LPNWLSQTVKDQKKKQEERIFDLWMQCYSQQDIAKAVGTTKQNISICQKKYTDTNFDKSSKTAANFEGDYNPPIYNVWTKASKTNEVDHFENSE